MLFTIAETITVNYICLWLSFRSTPCPNVKHGDDWGDPTQCENADGCAYCHTRTEQQFHPEVSQCKDRSNCGVLERNSYLFYILPVLLVSSSYGSQTNCSFSFHS